jgi:hypothetical protein
VPIIILAPYAEGGSLDVNVRYMRSYKDGL